MGEHMPDNNVPAYDDCTLEMPGSNYQHYAEWKAERDYENSSKNWSWKFLNKAARFFTTAGLTAIVPIAVVSVFAAMPHVPPEIVAAGRAGSNPAMLQTLLYILPYNWPTFACWGIVILCYWFMDRLIEKD